MSRFKIEDDWYIIVENYDYAIGKYRYCPCCGARWRSDNA